MSVVAYLVLGSDGSSTLHGTSAGITSKGDREAFLKARRSFDCILTGGASARTEPYSSTPVPLIVLSRTRPEVLDHNHQAVWWNCTPAQAIPRAVETYGARICVEGGVNFIRELIQENLIDVLNLSITAARGGENRLNYKNLLEQFGEVSTTEIDGTTFYVAQAPISTKQK